MIAIRADANDKIGTGHVMRCLAIANELEKLNEEVTFITADEYESELIKKWGFHHVVLKTDYTDMENELSKLFCVLQEIKVDCIIVDSYYASKEYLKQLTNSFVTVYIDDFAENKYPVDMLINYNISYSKYEYKRIYNNTDIKLLIGTSYVPLREEFSNVNPIHINDCVHNLLITTGGTDQFNVSTDLAKHIVQDTHFNDVNVHIVVGPFYYNIAELKQLTKKFSRIIIHENIKSMSKLMLECDIVVSASGTTLYELCVCGVPSIIFGLADNQIMIRKSFGESGAMIDLGDVRDDKSKCIINIIKELKLIGNKEKRTLLSKKANNITDGKGASRIAENILSLIKYKSVLKEG